MNAKAKTLERIQKLKRDKPDGWKREVRHLLNVLAYWEDPYGEHEYRGTECLGRKIHRMDVAPF